VPPLPSDRASSTSPRTPRLLANMNSSRGALSSKCSHKLRLLKSRRKSPSLAASLAKKTRNSCCPDGIPCTRPALAQSKRARTRPRHRHPHRGQLRGAAFPRCR